MPAGHSLAPFQTEFPIKIQLFAMKIILVLGLFLVFAQQFIVGRWKHKKVIQTHKRSKHNCEIFSFEIVIKRNNSFESIFGEKDKLYS